MAIGDDAQAAGMDLVLASDDAEDGYVEINRTRDYIAQDRRKSVRNISEDTNVIGIYWDPSRGHVVVRIDVTDIGHLALTEDVRLSRADLQNQIDALTQRIANLESNG